MKLILIIIALLQATSSMGLSKEELFQLDELEQKVLVLNQRESKIKKKYSDLESLSSYSGFIRKEQIEMMGPAGLFERTGEFQGQMDSVFEQWQMLITFLSNLNGEDLEGAIEDFEASLIKVYQNQDMIERLAKRINKDTNARYADLKLKSPLSPSLIPEKSETISKVNQSRESLLTAMEKIRAQTSESLMLLYRKTVNEFRRTMRLRLTSLQLQFPALQGQIKSAKDLLAVLDSFAPSMASFKENVLIFEMHLDKDAIYTASKLKSLIDAQYNQMQLDLEEFDAEQSSKASILKQLNFNKERADKALEYSLRSESKLDIFSRFAHSRFSRLTRRCRKDMTSSKVDCEQLRALVRFNIDPAEIEKRINAGDLNEDDLLFVESKIIEIDRKWRL